ncbi:MAG: plastocyanin/azurin family copper-binding protein [Candidatus Margulisiibacteriota bacterium]|nr:plastocyanin/azurin family copper-binding protein [Candidatus Margulisiibacteriota bacterium]
MKKLVLCVLLLTFFSFLGCKEKAEPALSITISSVGETMSYDKTSFTAKPNQQIELTFVNNASLDVMKHNIVFLSDETKANEVGQQALSAPNYIPDHPAIFAYSDLVGPKQKTSLSFKAPSKPGKYLYFCTFPGHYIMMKGYLVVKG